MQNRNQVLWAAVLAGGVLSCVLTGGCSKGESRIADSSAPAREETSDKGPAVAADGDASQINSDADASEPDMARVAPDRTGTDQATATLPRIVPPANQARINGSREAVRAPLSARSTLSPAPVNEAPVSARPADESVPRMMPSSAMMMEAAGKRRPSRR